MGCLRRALIAVMGLILILAAGFGGYAFGEDGGYNRGYEAGYEIGCEEGAGSGYTLRNPTYGEMMRFLADDRTDSREYVEGEYVCSDFAAAVNNNAEAEGFHAAIVLIDFPGERSHAVVAFDTVDKGLIFIEPQFDEVVEVSLGISYSQANGYQEPDYDDTIDRVVIVW